MLCQKNGKLAFPRTKWDYFLKPIPAAVCCSVKGHIFVDLQIKKKFTAKSQLFCVGYPLAIEHEQMKNPFLRLRKENAYAYGSVLKYSR